MPVLPDDPLRVDEPRSFPFKSAPEVKLLLLDACGVLLNDPFYDLLVAMAEDTGRHPGDVLRPYEDEVRELFWAGRMTEAEFWNRLLPGADPDPWRRRLLDSFETGPAFDRLASWAEFVPVWVLSNHRSAWLRPQLERHGLLPYLERVYISEEIGAAKPEEETYLRVLADFDGVPGQVLYADDKLRNVVPARRLGIRAFVADPQGDWVASVEGALIRP